MKRYSFWRTALADYLQRVSSRPFVPGEHDCALFAAGGVEAMTSEDFGAGYRGRYKTLAGGYRLLKKRGFESHADLAASIFEEIHPSHAMVGDIAAVNGDGGIALGIVQGEGVYVLSPEGRIDTVPLLNAIRAFRVPFTD